MAKNIKFITNAFSIQMLNTDVMSTVRFTPVSEDDFNKIKSSVPSAVGHADTARVLGVECNRINISLEAGDNIVVAQLIGGRLPEGSSTLPNGFKFRYILVSVSNV